MNISLINWHIQPKNTPLGAVPCNGLDSVYGGLITAGHSVKRINSPCKKTEDYVVCWGWKRNVAQLLMQRKKQVLVAELGYIGDRKTHISLGWNGLNNYASFPEYPDDGGKRFKDHGGIIKPWKRDGKYILVLGQVKGDASLKGQDIMPWYLKTAHDAYNHYGIPVYYRQHPESVRRRGYESLYGFDNIGGTLEEAMSDALFTIAYNSNSCLDSILAGIPCYAGDKGTMAWDLCMKDIKELYYPEREKTVYQIAWKQWTLDEIRQGIPFRKLFE